MTEFNIHRVNSLPSTGKNGDIYILKRGNKQEFYIVDPSGVLVPPLMSQAELSRLADTYTKSEVNAKDEATNERIDGLQVGYNGSITTTQTLPQLNALSNGVYRAQTNGAYANGLTAKEGYLTTFRKSGTTWTLEEEVKMPSATGSNQVVEGGQLLLNQDGGYKLQEDFNGKFNSVFEQSPNYTTVKGHGANTGWLYETSTFAGWGLPYGVVKNFNGLSFLLKDISDVSGMTKVSKLSYRVCEVDQNGAVLASGEVDVDIPVGQTREVFVQFPNYIENTANKIIWVEYWGNGNVPLSLSETGITPNINFRYKNTFQYPTDFSVSSQLTSSPQTRYPSVKFLNIEGMYAVKPSVADDVLSKGDAVGDIVAGEKKAPSGEKVLEYTSQFSDVIEGGLQIQNEDTFGGNSVLNATSTFAGWGQNVGIKTNFNYVRYTVRAYSASDIPTWVELTIRENDAAGAILYSVRVNDTFEHNVSKDVYFPLPNTFDNVDNKSLFIQFNSNGYIASIGSLSGSAVGALKYTTVKGTNTTPSATTSTSTLGMSLILGEVKGVIKPEVVEDLKQEILGGMTTPDLLLTSRVWLYPGFQYNIFNKNVCIPSFGDNLENYRLDFNDSGRQFKRGYRLDPIPTTLNQNLNLSLMRGRQVLNLKTQNILTSTSNNGSGNTRKVLIIGDSTVNGSNISSPLKTVFDSDVMNINLIGTLGNNGVKHEGRGGWAVADYYGIGRTLYMINVSGVVTNPGINSRYSQGASVYNVEEVNITGGSGYFSVSLVSGSAPTTSGTLTKSSGTGDNTINYSSSSVTSANPFYSFTTGKFDLAHYLTNTSQSLSANDWVFFQLGINDVFAIKDLPSAEAKVATMISQMKEMINNIHSYNSDIRVGVVVTFPPASQDGFGFNYSSDQLSEMYIKTGLITWQKKLLSEFDNTASNNLKTYLVSAHLNLDSDYNYPTEIQYANSRTIKQVEVQNNGVHPSPNGYAQIADMYAGLIKYFG